MCSKETVTNLEEGNIMHVGRCGVVEGWEGEPIGRGASPDPSSNIHYIFKLIQCTIYCTCTARNF